MQHANFATADPCGLSLTVAVRRLVLHARIVWCFPQGQPIFRVCISWLSPTCRFARPRRVSLAPADYAHNGEPGREALAARAVPAPAVPGHGAGGHPGHRQGASVHGNRCTRCCWGHSLLLGRNKRGARGVAAMRFSCISYLRGFNLKTCVGLLKSGINFCIYLHLMACTRCKPFCCSSRNVLSCMVNSFCPFQ